MAKRTPAYSEVTDALIYFTYDKSFDIYGVSDLHGWTNEQYVNFKDGEVVTLTASFDFQEYKVRKARQFKI